MRTYQVRAVVEAINVDEARLKAKQLFEAQGVLRADEDNGCAFGVIDAKSYMDKSEVEESRTFWACPECGCTDVECTAWISVNSDQVSSGDAPSDNAWCPQCEYNGVDGDMKYRHLVEVNEAKPICYDDEKTALSG